MATGYQHPSGDRRWGAPRNGNVRDARSSRPWCRARQWLTVLRELLGVGCHSRAAGSLVSARSLRARRSFTLRGCPGRLRRPGRADRGAVGALAAGPWRRTRRFLDPGVVRAGRRRPLKGCESAAAMPMLGAISVPGWRTGTASSSLPVAVGRRDQCRLSHRRQRRDRCPVGPAPVGAGPC